jgi:hypothetical protein
LEHAGWEGKKVNWIEGSGFDKTNFRRALDLANIFGGLPFTNQMRISAAEILMATGCYEKVSTIAEGDQSRGGVRITIKVVERAGSIALPEDRK